MGTAPELAHHIACVWCERPPYRERVLPDGYVDLVWSGTGAFVRGPDTRAHSTGPFADGRVFVGLRLRPRVARTVLGTPVAELVDARAGISALWGDRAMRRMCSARAVAPCPNWHWRWG